MGRLTPTAAPAKPHLISPPSPPLTKNRVSLATNPHCVASSRKASPIHSVSHLSLNFPQFQSGRQSPLYTPFPTPTSPTSRQQRPIPQAFSPAHDTSTTSFLTCKQDSLLSFCLPPPSSPYQRLPRPSKAALTASANALCLTPGLRSVGHATEC